MVLKSDIELWKSSTVITPKVLKRTDRYSGFSSTLEAPIVGEKTINSEPIGPYFEQVESLVIFRIAYVSVFYQSVVDYTAAILLGMLRGISYYRSVRRLNVSPRFQEEFRIVDHSLSLCHQVYSNICWELQLEFEIPVHHSRKSTNWCNYESIDLELSFLRIPSIQRYEIQYINMIYHINLGPVNQFW